MQLSAVTPVRSSPSSSITQAVPDRLEVIAWLREGRFGGAGQTEWVLDSRTGTNAIGPRFEVRRDDYVGGTHPLRSQYRFAHELPASARPQALVDVRAAADLIRSTAHRLGLREVSADVPFFGRREQGGVDGADVALGEGKLLVRDGASSRAFVGDLDAMRAISDLVRRTVSSVLRT